MTDSDAQTASIFLISRQQKYTCVGGTQRTRDARGARSFARARVFLPALVSIAEIKYNSNSIFQVFPKRVVVKFKYSSIKPTDKIYMISNVFGLITGKEEKPKYYSVSQRVLSSYTFILKA